MIDLGVLIAQPEVIPAKIPLFDLLTTAAVVITFVRKILNRKCETYFRSTTSTDEGSAMAVFTAKCPCGTPIRLPENLLGKNIRCPKCSKILMIPDPAAKTPAKGLAPKEPVPKRPEPKGLAPKHSAHPESKSKSSSSPLDDPFGSSELFSASPFLMPAKSPAATQPEYAAKPLTPKSAASNPGNPPLLGAGSQMIVGIASAFFGVLMLLFGISLSISEVTVGSPKAPYALMGISVFCGIISVACFVKASRVITLRIIGTVLSLFFIGAIVAIVTSDNRRGLALPIVFLPPSVYMAIKGNWPERGN